ncbi:M15 family metallopeptidase [Granulicoccus phenolivorans]|uniref:M15 family metallopeptidase n=1 Tax=Granulicoccus phenolivorans TaxID=266854 RepID=UPI0003FAEBC1|nr:M15 family metallopeptidase [Granulicoccus phenolivorans]
MPQGPLDRRVIAVVLASVLLVVGLGSFFILQSYQRNTPQAAGPVGGPAATGTNPGTATPQSQTAEPTPQPPTTESQAPAGDSGKQAADPAAEARIDDPASLAVVVNKQRPLPRDYAPKGLVVARGLPNGSSERVRPEAAEALERMAAEAQAQGVRLSLTSGYRSYADQQSIYGNNVTSKGRDQADRISARPGHSEHQTGLAIDLTGADGNCTLLPCFGTTTEGRWLAENAWRYGFLLRYPQDLTPVVGYAYEPWHFRYVGPELTEKMRAIQVRSLEEYFHLPAAPGYA